VALTDEEVRIDVDIDLEVACEGLTHPAGTHWHDGGPARWRLICPECGYVVLQCEGRAMKLRSEPTILCSCCNTLFAAKNYGFFLL
jgi:hypothetical protein